MTSQRGAHPKLDEFRAIEISKTATSLHYVKNKCPLLSRAAVLSPLTAFISSAKVAQADSPQPVEKKTQFSPNQFYLCSNRKQNNPQ